MERVRICPPWFDFKSKIEALFGSDPDIKIETDEEDLIIRLYVKGTEKADALTQLLPKQVEFGGVLLYISVIPANDEDNSPAALFKKAFDGNPAVSCLASVEAHGGTLNYLMFRNCVVQFWNDNLADPYGNSSMLYEDIAKEIFKGTEGVFFSTDTPGNLGFIQKNAKKEG